MNRSITTLEVTTGVVSLLSLAVLIGLPMSTSDFARHRHLVPSDDFNTKVSANVSVDYVDLAKSRLAVVRIPAGQFRMGTDQVIRADDFWKPCPSCDPRNNAER